MKHVSDAQIVEDLAAGEEESLKVLQARYGAYVRKIARDILRSEEDAREVENEVYLKLWQSIRQSGIRSLKSFLGMLARQLAVDRLRKNAARRRGSGTCQAAFEELEEVLADAGGEDPAETLALQEALDAFLRSLAKKQRRLFLCRYWYGMSIRECAQAFQMKESAVKTGLMRSRKKLEAYLKKEEILL